MTSTRPALLGGDPLLPAGLPLVRPPVGDLDLLLPVIRRILDSGALTNGAVVRQLEEEVADRLQVPHVVAVSSCTAGLMLVLQSLGADGPVVMPSFTFSASAHAVTWAGGQPVWADVHADALTLDAAEAELVLEGAVAMTATHIYGTPCRTESLSALAESAGIPLVYDSAHALGSMRRGRPVGGFGTAEVFSLSPTKVTTAAEGGLVATHDAEVAQHVRYGRNYGNPGDYDCPFPGLNARMSEIHAAVALASLAGLDQRVAARAELVERFRARTGGLPGLTFPVVDDGDVSTYKDLTLVVEPDRFGLTAPELASALTAEGIESRRYFWPPVHQQKAYAHLFPRRPLPVTDDLSQRVLTLPLESTIEAAGVMDRVADAVLRVQEHAADVRAGLP